MSSSQNSSTNQRLETLREKLLTKGVSQNLQVYFAVGYEMKPYDATGQSTYNLELYYSPGPGEGGFLLNASMELMQMLQTAFEVARVNQKAYVAFLMDPDDPTLTIQAVYTSYGISSPS